MGALSGALSFLRLRPEGFHRIQVHVPEARLGLDRAEAGFKLAIGFAQRGFRLDVQMACEVDDGEKEVAHFFQFALMIGLGLQFGQFLVDLSSGAADIRPIETGAGGAALRWLTAAALVAFGVLKLVRPRHPRWVGMRVGFLDLTWWSFLMATAHGAGLMLLPVFLLGAESPAPCHGGGCHNAAGLSLASPLGYLAAVLVHTAAMMAAAAAVALVVYHKLGVAILRTAWFNLDRAWAVALIGAGVIAVLL